MAEPNPLPPGIDWGELDIRLTPQTVAAYWRDHCIATCQTGRDKLGALNRLREKVRNERHRYARRQACASAPKDLDKVFAAFAAKISLVRPPR